MFKLMTIVGARPQFIKAAAVSHVLRDNFNIKEIMLHTGQHFDENMSDIFFNQLNIPKPEVMLDINGSSHGAMTGRMIEGIEEAIFEHKPDGILLYGDTNSTLAGAIAASKLHVPIFHIESGLRSGNMRMPEEINRILTDQVSDTLYCPTEAAMNNLRIENVAATRNCRVRLVGDVMQDASIMFSRYSSKPTDFEHKNKFCLCTIHRAENTDDPIKLKAIFEALDAINLHSLEVVMPLHPRTKALLEKHNIETSINIIEPASYLNMLWLLDNCEMVITDSGGVQKEAYFFNKNCLTVRDQTEWVELIDLGVNMLTPATYIDIRKNFNLLSEKKFLSEKDLYGGGDASRKIVEDIIARLAEVNGE
ncbi:UDP-N-acetylglucosamine 2-epimerase [Vibrio splendidus ZS-139]|nr:UDP-N-acetylglucosamine 2-epimerase [Vibrio splendidus ZS-139]